jgi:hypothetical protein
MSIRFVSIFGIRFVYEYFEFGCSAMGPCGASASAIQASVAWGGWGLERGWGEVGEGEGGIFGKGM